MYALDINFLDDRQEVAGGATERVPIADTQFLIGGGAVMAVALALAAGAYFFVQYSASDTTQKLNTLTAQEKDLDTKLAQLQTSEKAIKEIDERTDNLLKLFVGDIPLSALLEDIKVRTPANIKIDGFNQSEKTIKLTGQGLSYNDVNDFVLLLQTSPFLDPAQTRLEGARRQEDKGSAGLSLVSYEITATLTSKSAIELFDDLRKANALGTVARIQQLRQAGVIKQ